jgi:hypothetical protein
MIAEIPKNILAAEINPIFDGSNTVLIDFGRTALRTFTPKKSDKPIKNTIPPKSKKITPSIDRSILAVFDGCLFILNNKYPYIKIHYYYWRSLFNKLHIKA